VDAPQRGDEALRQVLYQAASGGLVAP
jgi:hypothetical protein